MSNLKTQNHNSNLKSNVKYRAYNFSLMIIRFINQLPNKKRHGTDWLNLVLVQRDKTDKIIKESNEISNMLSSNVLTLKGKRKI